jgi:arabinosaccharide transport system substrate-binding protein
MRFASRALVGHRPASAAAVGRTGGKIGRAIVQDIHESSQAAAWRRWRSLPIGPLVLVALALTSSVAMVLSPVPRGAGMRFWTFARLHHQMYVPQVEVWNQSQRPQVQLSLLSINALEQRMLSAFLAETTVAELIEVERRNAARAFAGPLESVGFVDLTDRLRAEGLDQAINAASFSPWTSRGRVFGLPHDVHPVMLAYRADIIEAAGIDVSSIETWDDFARVLRPLMVERDADGRPKRYLLNLWETHIEVLELLLLQAGGGLFDEFGRPTLDRPVNAEVVAQIVAWLSGPDRIAADAPYFSASGNRLLLDGYVLASFMPDWMCNVWRNEIPQLAGEVKLMPLPAWTSGGRRTSVWGGTMVGISRTAEDMDAAWRFAKHLYLSPDLARELYFRGDIVTPVKSLWSDPIFDQPDAYFSGQAKGRLYINLASQVPLRHSSPFGVLAATRFQNVVVELARRARSGSAAGEDAMRAQARELLSLAQREIAASVRRNVFVAEEAFSHAKGDSP